MPKTDKTIDPQTTHDAHFLFRTAYDNLQSEYSDSTGLDCSGDPGLTQQNFSAECDINNIMAQYKATGLVRVSQSYARGDYRDLSDAPTFYEAMNVVATANSAFQSLPAELRKRFNNDPALFLDFVADPKNREEMETLGLTKPKEAPPGPIDVRVLSPDPLPDSPEGILRSYAERIKNSGTPHVPPKSPV